MTQLEYLKTGIIDGFEDEVVLGRDAPENSIEWLEELFPTHIEGGFAPHHLDYWQWVDAVKPGEYIRPFGAFWPRGGAKSSSVELSVVRMGATKVRRFLLYVCETQEQANAHLANIASMMESATIEHYYPNFSRRRLNKYGHSSGWKVSMLRSNNGFNGVALGLNTAGRGFKLDDVRPDLFVFDDIDGELDTEATVQKKINLLTKKILPMGSPHATKVFVQNLIHENSIASKIVNHEAEFLQDIVISGPIEAVEGLEYERREDGRTYITAGEASWSGQDIEACQNFINDFGITAFLTECQHDVSDPAGGMFSHLEWLRCDIEECPDFVSTTVWVDPAVTSTDKSDAMGIQADALGVDGKIYRLYSWEQITSPVDALKRAIRKAIELKADSVGVETDQGGDTWQSVFREALEEVKKEMTASGELNTYYIPSYKSEKAGSGHGPKRHRAQQMLSDYERGKIVHVRGTHATLEKALYRFPLKKPYDLVDAGYWSWNELRHPSASAGGFHQHF